MLTEVLSYSDYVKTLGHEPELVPAWELADIYEKHPVHVETPTKEELLEQVRFVDGGVVVDMPLKGTGGGAYYLQLHVMLEAYLLLYKPDEVEWKRKDLFNLDYEIMMIEKWVHPYVWYDPTRLDGVISDGRIACEMYIPKRRLDVFPYINHFEECRLLSFADDVPEFQDAEVRHKKGTHDWKWLSGNYSGLVASALNGEEIDDEDFDSIVWYDGFVLRERLERIAKKRGGARAAELLRLYQEEWPDIKRWRVDFGEMEDEEIEAFEDMLLDGMDDLLSEWEQEEPEAALEVPESRFCKYIAAERFVEKFNGQYTVEDYEATLHEASKGTAKHFASVLMDGAKSGVLDFHGDGASAILTYFQEHFPDMKHYSYQNFSREFSLPR